MHLFYRRDVVPPEPAHLFGRQEIAVGVVEVRRTMEVTVRDRVDEGLKRDRWTTAIARHQAQHSSDVPASTVAADRDSGAIDIQIDSLTRDPLQRRVTIFNCGRIFVFGRQSVIDRHKHESRRGGESPRNIIVRVDVVQDPAATMEIEACTERSRSLWPIDANP